MKKLLSFGTSIAPKKLIAITIINSDLIAWYMFLSDVNFEAIFKYFPAINKKKPKNRPIKEINSFGNPA